MPNGRIVPGRPGVKRSRFVRGRFDFIKMEYFEHSWLPYCMFMLVACLFGVSQVRAAGLASARDQVPPSSQRQWAPPNLAGYQNTLQKSSAEALEKGKELVDFRKEYTLLDLIDLAEQLDPATRAAWQNARQALALVGVSKSAYLPFSIVSGSCRLYKVLRSLP